jgi:hypothetical protein
VADNARVVVASAARTASGNSGSLAVREESDDRLSLLLSVTAVAGTGPTLDVSVEWSHDGGVTFAAADPPDSFAQVIATGNKIESYTIKAAHYRVVWTLGGTAPSFTFSVSEYAN